jgi:hypothetical protein
MWADSKTVDNGYAPVNLVAGVGIVNDTGTTFMGVIAVAGTELGDSLDFSVGHTFVIDYEVEAGSDGEPAIAGFTADDWFAYENGWYTQTGVNNLPGEVPGAFISDYATEYAQDTANGRSGAGRLAFSFSPDELAMSLNGGPVVTTPGNPQDIAATLSGFYCDAIVRLNSDAVSVFKRIVAYPLLPSSLLPGLSV